MNSPLTDLVLLAAANGRTGRAVLKALVRRGTYVRALIRKPEQAEALVALGARECAIGDLTQAQALQAAMIGCATAIYIGPPMHAEERSMALAFYAAAERAGCRHFVYYSVLHPVCREIRHHRLKLEVEEEVVNGPLPFTILQPSRYMQHLEPLLPAVRDQGIHAMPFSIDVRFNVVDLEDVAEAVALAVVEPKLRYGTFELAGPEALSQLDMAATLTTLLGRPVAAQALSLETMRARALAAGASADRVEQMSIMNSHYDRHGMRGNPLVLETLLARPATRFEAYARRVLGVGAS
jgi:uncharacterized protein YbjT (DUF2867 family)